MSVMRTKLQEKIERKIQEKRKEKEKLLNPASSFNEESLSSSKTTNARDHIKQWMKGLQLNLQDEASPYSYHNQHSDGYQYGQDDEQELDEVRVKIHCQEKQMDKCKYILLEITKQMQMIEYRKGENSQKNQKQLDELKKLGEEEVQSIKRHYEQKIDKYLQQIDTLLQEKAEFNQQCQIFIQEDTKMNKIVKDLEERYRKDMKNAKEAFYVLEKEKREKWEQSKLMVMKEEATLRLEPKLQAIIKDSNDDVKKSSAEWEKKVVDFKRDYVNETNKKLIDIKQKVFKQGEAEKDVLRSEERKRLKQSYEKLQGEFEEDRQKMRRAYKEQIIQLEKKRREEVDEFLEMNKHSHEDHLQKIKKMREDFQDKIRELKNNVRERTEEELNKVDRRFRKKKEEEEKRILEQNEQKFEKAKTKIDETIKNQEEDAKLKIRNMKQQMERDIQIKYQKRIDKARNQYQEEKKKLRDKIQYLQDQLISEEMSQMNERKRTSQYHKDYLKVEQKNDELRHKTKQKQSEIGQIRERIVTVNMRYEHEIRDIENRKRKEYEGIDKAIGKKRLAKQRFEQELIEKYSQLDDQNLDRVKQIKEQVNSSIKQQESVIKQLAKTVKMLKERNEVIEEELQKARNKMRNL